MGVAYSGGLLGPASIIIVTATSQMLVTDMKYKISSDHKMRNTAESKEREREIYNYHEWYVDSGESIVFRSIREVRVEDHCTNLLVGHCVIVVKLNILFYFSLTKSTSIR